MEGAETHLYIQEAVREHLASALESVPVEPLEGGYGTAANMKLEVAGKPYVLRVLSNLDSPLQRSRELHALKEAAGAGVAPAVRWVSADGFGILMDYIAGGTLTTEQAKRPEIVLKVADLLRKVHALPKNPFRAPSFEAQMVEAVEQYARRDSNQAIWKEAISLIQAGEAELARLQAPRVNTHGDLNPRNILLSEPDVYFIDWGDEMYTDPFQDLAFFSIMVDYDAAEEAYFLQCYLGRAPDSVEKKRWQIAKKMNFARLVLSGQAIGNELNIHQTSPVVEPLRQWSDYAKAFANGPATLSASFFWGLAQVALAAARAL